MTDFDYNRFPAGLLITDKNKHIVFANDYFSDELDWQDGSLIGKKLETLLTKSSMIFYESYVVPLLVVEKRFQEIQLSVLTASGERVPVLVNTRVIQQQSGFVYWSFFSASNRITLYQELIETRKDLYAQTETLKKLAITDELTGLFNRRELQTRANHNIARSKRFVSPLALLIIDVDHFKKVNDKLGHDKGDLVLVELSKTLTSLSRELDTVARFGGEEFAILAPDTSTEQAFIFSQRIHEIISTKVMAEQVITVSIGIATLDDTQNKTFHELFVAADTALYQAKNAGRNQSVIYTKNIN
ncbi:MAG: sensor domain-containing diguanylate cyclase [Paraglaciecola sp.]|nr:sensor domain-containing diguanylate cyclase [Paraglaciecola sp.]